jgi:hypothetical protein
MRLGEWLVAARGSSAAAWSHACHERATGERYTWIMVLPPSDRDVATRLLVAHGFLTRCAVHPDVVLDEGNGGRPDQVANALASTCTRFGSREDLEVVVRNALAAAGDLCPHCNRAGD